VQQTALLVPEAVAAVAALETVMAELAAAVAVLVYWAKAVAAVAVFQYQTKGVLLITPAVAAVLAALKVEIQMFVLRLLL
jgi:hypothetical protein